MKKNICKFSTAWTIGTLSIYQYIRETEREVMCRHAPLSYHRMLLVMQGSGVFYIDRLQLSFRAGDILFGFCGEQFWLQEGTDVQYMYIDFQGGRAEELFRRFEINATRRCFSGHDGLIPLWEESLARASEQTIDLAGESMLLYAFSRLMLDSPMRDGLVARVISLTDEEFTDPTLSMSGIADTLGYNAKYLSHAFKKQTGVNYAAYLRSVRIKYAVALLDQGLESIKNVALLSGFSDPLYFSNVFKEEIGISPKAYVYDRNEKKGEKL
jgi:AraC-like DNA-binding protein